MSIIPNINNQSIAILSDIEQWKEDIADAINTKGGNSTPDESFQQLAEDIKELPIRSLSDAGYTFADGYKPQTYSELIEYRNKIIEIDDPTVTTIDANYAFANLSSLRKVRMVNLEVITGTKCFNNDSNLEELEFPKLRTIYSLPSTAMHTFKTKQEELILPNLESISGNYIFTEVLSKSVIMPLLSTVNSQTLGFEDTLQNIVFGTLTTYRARISTNSTVLRNITIGENTDINLSFQYWTANNVISEGQSGIDELNSNLYNNLLTKLYDHSNDGETRILQIDWLDYITPENIAYATAKGWTITN